MASYKRRRRETLNRPFPKKMVLLWLLMTAISLGFLITLQIFEIDIDEADMVVYQSKKCSCVNEWIAQLKSEGYSVAVKKPMFVSVIRQKNDIPKEFSSCHTTIAGQYFIEGHVPMRSVNFLLDTQPNVAGIAPLGEMEGEYSNMTEMKTSKEVVAFSDDGRYSIFEQE